MKRSSIVLALILIAGLGLSSEASACGRRCKNVAPLGQPTCVRCVEDATAVGDCVNRPAPCGCFVKACEGFSAADKGEETALAGIFSADVKPVACSTLPAEITESVAD
jgi:hypothetical protein